MQFKIKKITILIFLLLIPSFKPTFFDVIGIISNIYKIMTLITFVGILLIHIIKKKNISNMALLFIIYELLIVMSTYIQRGNVKESIISAINILNIILVIDFYSEYMNSFLYALMAHFEICVYINLATLLIWPNGMYGRSSNAYSMTQEWFLGWDNIFIVWLFPALCIALLFMYYNKKKIRPMMLICAVVLTVLNNWVATASVGIFIVISCISVPFIKKHFTPIKTFICAFAVFIFIVVVQNFDFLKPIIEGVLQKDMTFNSRIGIWNNAMLAIKDNWLIGYGILYSNDMIKCLGWKTATHCHNQYLQIFFQGGIILFVNYILIQIEAIKKLSQNWNSQVSKVIAYSIFAFNIMCITEPYNYGLMFLLFILAEHNEKLKINN